MGSIFAYNSHDGFKDDMFLTGHKLSSSECWCPVCEAYDKLICEVVSLNQLLYIMHDHGIDDGSGEYIRLMEQYVKFSGNPLHGIDRMRFIHHITGFWIDDSMCPEAKMSEDQLMGYIHDLTVFR